MVGQFRPVVEYFVLTHIPECCVFYIEREQPS
jgi:hypothetical protein